MGQHAAAFDRLEMQRGIPGLPDEGNGAAALVDSEWNIMGINAQWRDNVGRRSPGEFGLGCNLLTALQQASQRGDAAAGGLHQSFQEMRELQLAATRIVVSDGGREHLVAAVRVPLGKSACAIVSKRDLQLHTLSGAATSKASPEGSIERLRLGRELHDSTGQSIAALRLGIARLRRSIDPHTDSGELDAMEGTLKTLHESIRAVTRSCSVSPVHSMGMTEAMQTLVEGFGLVTGLRVSLRLDELAGNVAMEMQAGVYRLVQEALVNVHRHAAARRAEVRILVYGGLLHVLVVDDGAGFAAAAGGPSPGVGLRGMWSRVKELGGQFVLGQLGSGVAVAAVLPVGLTDALDEFEPRTEGVDMPLGRRASDRRGRPLRLR